MKYIFFFLATFLLLGCQSSWKSSSNEKQIAIQPLGDLDASLMQEVHAALNKIYDADITVLPPIDLPASAFTQVKSPRYRADSLIRFLKTTRPDTIDIILGLTKRDISTTKRDQLGNIKKPVSRYADWGIFGLGYRPGPSCIVSTYRLRHSKSTLFIDRLQKVCVHEVGHNLGLKHCPNKKCVMTDACETIKTVDQVSLRLCEKCTSKIK